MNERFGKGTHSFNVSTSWSICMRLVYDEPHDPEIADYAPVISDLLRILHTLGSGSVRLQKYLLGVFCLLLPTHCSKLSRQV